MFEALLATPALSAEEPQLAGTRSQPTRKSGIAPHRNIANMGTFVPQCTHSFSYSGRFLGCESLAVKIPVAMSGAEW